MPLITNDNHVERIASMASCRFGYSWQICKECRRFCEGKKQTFAENDQNSRYD